MNPIVSMMANGAKNDFSKQELRSKPALSPTDGGKQGDSKGIEAAYTNEHLPGDRRIQNADGARSSAQAPEMGENGNHRQRRALL